MLEGDRPPTLCPIRLGRRHQQGRITTTHIVLPMPLNISPSSHPRNQVLPVKLLGRPLSYSHLLHCKYQVKWARILLVWYRHRRQRTLSSTIHALIMDLVTDLVMDLVRGVRVRVHVPRPRIDPVLDLRETPQSWSCLPRDVLPKGVTGVAGLEGHPLLSTVMIHTIPAGRAYNHPDSPSSSTRPRA